MLNTGDTTSEKVIQKSCNVDIFKTARNLNTQDSIDASEWFE